MSIATGPWTRDKKSISSDLMAREVAVETPLHPHPAPPRRSTPIPVPSPEGPRTRRRLLSIERLTRLPTLLIGADVAAWLVAGLLGRPGLLLSVVALVTLLSVVGAGRACTAPASRCRCSTTCPACSWAGC